MTAGTRGKVWVCTQYMLKVRANPPVRVSSDGALYKQSHSRRAAYRKFYAAFELVCESCHMIQCIHFMVELDSSQTL